LLDSIGNDPITPLVILTAMLSPWALRCDRRLPAGIALYVAYVVWVGGDFMSGRFFSAPLLCAVVHLARLPLAPRFGAGWATAVALIWLVGVSGPRPVITSDASFGDIVPDEAVPVSHVTDERRYYYKASGLMTLHPGAEAPDHRWLHLGEFVQRIHQQVMTIDAAGFEGFGAGPSVRFIDRWGLGDPLIARLPAEVPWQIGHFARRIPAGYELTLLEHRNLIVDPGVGAFYEKLRIITEDPIWSRERFLTILRMNLGRYDRFVASYGLVHLPLDALDRAAPDGSEWNAPPAIVLTLRGLTVSTDRPRCGGMVELSASANDTYRLRFRFDEKTIGERVVRRPLTVDGRLLTSRVSAPDTFEWNTIDVLPAGGDSKYSVGHMRWLP
jgi:arabinofuranosyltransferase